MLALVDIVLSSVKEDKSEAAYALCQHVLSMTPPLTSHMCSSVERVGKLSVLQCKHVLHQEIPTCHFHNIPGCMQG